MRLPVVSEQIMSQYRFGLGIKAGKEIMKAVKMDEIKLHSLSITEMQALHDLKDRIEADPGSVPNSYTLARDYGISISKLTRSFKALYGKSLHAFVIDTRLSEAARLLKESSMPVCEIAEKTGYAKTSQFSAAFKKHFGVLPSEF